MSCLTSLPQELILHIVSLLDGEEPPSKRYLHEEPSISSLFSSHCPLKSLAQTCRLLYRTTFPRLFFNLKSDVRDSKELLAFVRAKKLQGAIRGLVLYSPGSEEQCQGYHCAPFNNLEDLNDNEYRAIWSKALAVLDLINPVSVTLILPPFNLQFVLPYEPELEDAWAFNIQYQALYFEQLFDVAQQNKKSSSALDRDILSLRPWSHITYNEGSSIEAYSTYEYFSKDVPSMMFPPYPQSLARLSKSLGHLTTFHYIAVFPINKLYQRTNLLECMRSLQFLSFRFSPSPTSNVLDNPSALGKCQRSDLWSELSQKYQASIEWLWYCPITTLKEFTILDFNEYDIPEMLKQYRGPRIEGPEPWRLKWDGRWMRDR